MLTTTDHQLIGQMYLVTLFVWFLVGGVMAMMIRAELLVVLMLVLSIVILT